MNLKKIFDVSKVQDSEFKEGEKVMLIHGGRNTPYTVQKYNGESYSSNYGLPCESYDIKRDDGQVLRVSNFDIKKIIDNSDTNALTFLQERFDDRESDIKEFVETQWDKSKSDYENLKEFKIYIDDKYDNFNEGGDLFEVSGEYEGTITPLYIVEDFNGVDYDFAEQWVKDVLSDEGLEVEKFWTDDRDSCWSYTTK